MQTNAEYARQSWFKETCDTVFGVWYDQDGNEHSNRQHKHLPLTRQASKFRRGKGIVYQRVQYGTEE